MIAQKGAEISKIEREIKAEEESQRKTEERDDVVLEEFFAAIQGICDMTRATISEPVCLPSPNSGETKEESPLEAGVKSPEPFNEEFVDANILDESPEQLVAAQEV